MNKFFLSLCLALLFSLCIGELSDNTIEQSADSSPGIEEKQIDEERLQEVNSLINSYFANCSLEAQTSLIYGCSMPKQRYAEFLYTLFHKEHVMNFIKLYQANGEISTEKDISQMYKIGQKVHQIVLSAYKQWIDVYKPNQNITVEQMYRDIPDLDQQVLDIIQHYQSKYKDFIDVLTLIYKVKRTTTKYMIMGNSTEEQIAEDYEGILKIYFGDCEPITSCKMSLKAFVYFLKELSFYITPLVDSQSHKRSILVSEDLDFEATQFLIQEVNQIKEILGETVDYSQIQTYSQGIAMNLFQHLKHNQKNQERNESLEEQSTNQTQKSEL